MHDARKASAAFIVNIAAASPIIHEYCIAITNVSAHDYLGTYTSDAHVAQPCGTSNVYYGSFNSG
jgi:hypothetical protein